jgi:magnesium transporter
MVQKQLKRLVPKRLIPKSHIVPGAAPGSIEPHGTSRASRFRIMAYGPEADGILDREVSDASELAGVVGTRSVLWVDVIGMGSSEELERIQKLFGVHPLVLEDVVHGGQRPKVEEYEESAFVVVHGAARAESLVVEQVGFLIKDGVVISFREEAGGWFEPVRDRIRNRGKRITESGADYLAYALIDALIDHFFPIIEKYGDRLEQIELSTTGVKTPERSVVMELHDIRHDLLVLRRSLVPARDLLSRISNGDVERITPHARVYFRDCADHVERLIDASSFYRELAQGLVEISLSAFSNEMNQVMKVLTIIATIFIPLSFIAGVYGMNFDTSSPLNLPELGWRYGYPFALGIMALTAAGLLVYFIKKGWLGKN